MPRFLFQIWKLFFFFNLIQKIQYSFYEKKLGSHKIQFFPRSDFVKRFFIFSFFQFQTVQCFYFFFSSDPKNYFFPRYGMVFLLSFLRIFFFNFQTLSPSFQLVIRIISFYTKGIGQTIKTRCGIISMVVSTITDAISCSYDRKEGILRD